MATLAEVKQAFQSYVQDVKQDYAALNDKINTLTQQIASGSTEAADLDSLVQDVKAAQADLATSINQPVAGTTTGSPVGTGTPTGTTTGTDTTVASSTPTQTGTTPDPNTTPDSGANQ